jgi:DNA-binding transcriptional LysR family regulator
MIPADLRLLRSFVMLARRLSFTRAAVELNMSQPTLTLQIRKLESLLGFELFARSTRNISITPRGAELLPWAEQMIEGGEMLERKIRLIRERDKRRITLGTPMYMMDIPIRNLLIERFAAQYPRVEIKIHNDWQPNLLRALETGSIDAALTSGRPVSRERFEALTSRGRRYEGIYPEDLNSVILCRARVGLLIPREMERTNVDEIDPSALSGLSIVALPNSCPPIFDPLYALLSDRGANLLRAPEQDAICIQRYARRRRLPTISMTWFDEVSGSDDIMVRKLIAGFDLEVVLALVSQPGIQAAEVKLLAQVAAGLREPLAPALEAR